MPIAREKKKPETCNQVFDRFVARCELRVSKDDMALSTLKSYSEIIDRVFLPEIGEEPFEDVLYSRLAEIVANNTKGCKKKTYNNITSAVRTAFTFGYKDLPGKPSRLGPRAFPWAALDRNKGDVGVARSRKLSQIAFADN